MGLREKVTPIFIVLVILRITVNCLSVPQNHKNRHQARSTGALRKYPSKYSIMLPQTQSFESPPEKYGDHIRRDFNFPEIEYSGKSKCFPNLQYQEPLSTVNSLGTLELDYKSHDLFSACNQKNIIKKSIYSNSKTEQSTPVLFSEFSSAPNYQHIYNFPEVEYPLCASETWKPYYFNGFLTDTPSTNNFYSSDKKLNQSEGKPFGNIIKSNKITSSCGFNKAPEKVTMIDKNLNATRLESKQKCFNVTSYNSSTTNIKTCDSMLRNEDKSFTVLSRPEDCGISVLPTEDRENQFGLNDEDYTTDDPEYEETSPFAHSTVAPPVLTSNDITWENTKVVEKYVPDVDELNDYFISV